MEHDGRSLRKERMVDHTLELEVNASFVIPKEMGIANADNVIWAQRIMVSPLNDGKSRQSVPTVLHDVGVCVLPPPRSLE